MLCDGLDDVELRALVTELRSGVKEAMIGGGVAVIAGEGRRMEYTRANLKDLKAELAAAQRELARRDPNYDAGGALAVEF